MVHAGERGRAQGQTAQVGKGAGRNGRKTPRLRTRITSKVRSLEEPPPWGLLACGLLLAVIARVLIVVFHDSAAEWDIHLAATGRDLGGSVEGAIQSSPSGH